MADAARLAREDSLGKDTPGLNNKSRGAMQRGNSKGCTVEKAEHTERENGYRKERLLGDREKPNVQDSECQVQVRV